MNIKPISRLMGHWLETDYYPTNDNNKFLSATTILKSDRQIILSKKSNNTPKPMSMLALRIGTAIHDSIEKSWLKSKNTNNIVINPTDLSLVKDKDVLYLEQRKEKSFNSFIISGQFDACLNGQLEDYKTSSVQSYILNPVNMDYIMQLSIYKWLNPDIVTSEYGIINYIFKDWNQSKASVGVDYPSQPIISKKVKLLTNEQVEEYLLNRTNSLLESLDKPDNELPYCTEDELWSRTRTQYQYFSKETNKRANKNFKTQEEADEYLAEKGYIGTIKIKTIKPKIIKCKRYCVAHNECNQYLEMKSKGLAE